MFTKKGCDRVMRYAFDLAMTRKRREVASATKSNGISISMPYWDERFAAIGKEYPEVKTSQFHVDILAAHLVRNPHWFDVIVGSNLFGDILSDLGPATTGTIAIAPGGNINPERAFPSMFEPVHGSAPDIAGKGIANPIGQIWSGAMMLEHLGHKEAAAAIVKAIETLFADTDVRTADMGGKATCKELGEALVDAGEPRLTPLAPRRRKADRAAQSAGIAGTAIGPIRANHWGHRAWRVGRRPLSAADRCGARDLPPARRRVCAAAVADARPTGRAASRRVDRHPCQALRACGPRRRRSSCRPTPRSCRARPRSHATAAAAAGGGGQLSLVALLTQDGQSIEQGLVWRVFRDRPGPDGKPRLVSTHREASPVLRLEPGEYVVNVAFGRANLTRKVTVSGERAVQERFVLNAGGLRLISADRARRGGRRAHGRLRHLFRRARPVRPAHQGDERVRSPASCCGSTPASTTSSAPTAMPTPWSAPT